jgi:hypothetical protein
MIWAWVQLGLHVCRVLNGTQQKGPVVVGGGASGSVGTWEQSKEAAHVCGKNKFKTAMQKDGEKKKELMETAPQEQQLWWVGVGVFASARRFSSSCLCECEWFLS